MHWSYRCAVRLCCCVPTAAQHPRAPMRANHCPCPMRRNGQRPITRNISTITVSGCNNGWRHLWQLLSRTRLALTTVNHHVPRHRYCSSSTAAPWTTGNAPSDCQVSEDVRNDRDEAAMPRAVTFTAPWNNWVPLANHSLWAAAAHSATAAPATMRTCPTAMLALQVFLALVLLAHHPVAFCVHDSKSMSRVKGKLYAYYIRTTYIHIEMLDCCSCC